MDLFVFDVDGTLSYDDCPLMPEEKKQMDRLLARGNAIAIASGRPQNGITKYLDELPASPLKFAICANGAEVYDATGRLLSRHVLTYADYLRIRRAYRTPRSVVYLYQGNVLASHDRSHFIDFELKGNRMSGLRDLNREPMGPKDPVTKVLVAAEPEDSAALEKVLAPADLAAYNIVRSSPTFLEFVNKAVDKQTGVVFLRNMLRLPRESVHTFGDSMNDLLMIKEFDGTAMGNAMPAVKKAARRITKSVYEDGVGYALKTWFADD